MTLYLMLTDECNMNCAHCVMDAKPLGCGHYMATEHAIRAIDLLPQSDTLCLGGGEPTLHPQFLHILCHALRRKAAWQIGVVTNGTNARISMVLLKLAQRRKMGAALSYTKYHNRAMVDPRVVKAFAASKHVNTNQMGFAIPPVIREIEHLIPEGRASRLKAKFLQGPCCKCRGWFVHPNGDIYRCGCVNATKWGNLSHLDELPGQRNTYCDTGVIV